MEINNLNLHSTNEIMSGQNPRCALLDHNYVMSGQGEGGTATEKSKLTEKSKSTEKKMSRSSRAGLVFPVDWIRRRLRKGNHAERVCPGASVYLTAVLEYLAAEVLNVAGTAARHYKKTQRIGPRINPHHLQLGIRNDEELDKLLSEFAVGRGGVLPKNEPVLLPKKTEEQE